MTARAFWVFSAFDRVIFGACDSGFAVWLHFGGLACGQAARAPFNWTSQRIL